MRYVLNDIQIIINGMDVSSVITFLQESLFFLVVFGVFLAYAMMRSTQSLVNLILGLYLALLISVEFPYYDLVLGGAEGNATSESTLMIIVFAVFTLLSTLLFSRLMPTDSTEPAFNQFTNKILFAIGATILIMVYSYHVLPVTQLIEPGTPVQYLFAAEENFFWWLLIPLVLLFLL